MKSSEKDFQTKKKLVHMGYFHFSSLGPYEEKRKPFREELSGRTEFQTTRKEKTVFYVPRHLDFKMTLFSFSGLKLNWALAHAVYISDGYQGAKEHGKLLF